MLTLHPFVFPRPSTLPPPPPVYRPSARLQSDQQALAEAKREAQGLPAVPKKQNHHGPGGKKAEMATDDVVMERFKKRMRKN